MRGITSGILILIAFTIGSCSSAEKEVESTYPDGKPLKVVYYKDIEGVRDLVKTEYYYTNGWLESETNYKNGKKNGKCLMYFTNGKVASQEYYCDDELHGKCHYFSETGKRRFTASYDHGISDGKWIIYDENGKKATVQIFENGKLIKQRNK
ncbi:MAG: toxin-antitoxin system YwqK family antitoxin [Bacteroidales bacterium]|jgi:antitoxin component YwqK of YwqJK toxin-antitoxin module|nr:toxin-antitoxin system YwqK family antitoxin [Bacteroidales bacterium]HOY38345.1 hypothetical protein [Bacteroidales bacterium]HQP03440.1 hypothetical protein [Bacteroidales bacterium]